MHDLKSKISDQIDAMLAYWDKDLICRFANMAYMQWFGKTPEEMIGKIHIKDLLGPLYEKNIPFIQAALRGEKQQFERAITTPAGEIRFALANYYPDERSDGIRGFFVHVADITAVKKLELEREKLIGELQAALGEIKTLNGLLPICAWCKKVRDDKGYWNQIEDYFSKHSTLTFSHGICNDCINQHSREVVDKRPL